MGGVVRRRYARARRFAEKMLWACGIDEPSKIDPMILVQRCKIAVAIGRLEGASARIFRDGERAIIRVSDHVWEFGLRRFTIAHEVGHFLLGHRIPAIVEVPGESCRGYDLHQEFEADVFATEFLLPEAWVAPYCSGRINLDAVHEIMTRFRATQLESALRFVELTETACAVVYSKHGRVVWTVRSRSFPHEIPEQLQIGRGSVASEYFERNTIDSMPRLVPASAWLAPPLATEVRSLIEQAEMMSAPAREGVLSLLATDDAVTDPGDVTAGLVDDPLVGAGKD